MSTESITSAIETAVSDLVCAMPNSSDFEPYDYSRHFQDIEGELSAICKQLERIADYLEAKGGK